MNEYRPVSSVVDSAITEKAPPALRASSLTGAFAAPWATPLIVTLCAATSGSAELTIVSSAFCGWEASIDSGSETATALCRAGMHDRADAERAGRLQRVGDRVGAVGGGVGPGDRAPVFPGCGVGDLQRNEGTRRSGGDGAGEGRLGAVAARALPTGAEASDCRRQHAEGDRGGDLDGGASPVATLAHLEDGVHLERLRGDREGAVGGGRDRLSARLSAAGPVAAVALVDRDLPAGGRGVRRAGDGAGDGDGFAGEDVGRADGDRDAAAAVVARGRRCGFGAGRGRFGAAGPVAGVAARFALFGPFGAPGFRFLAALRVTRGAFFGSERALFGASGVGGGACRSGAQRAACEGRGAKQREQGSGTAKLGGQVHAWTPGERGQQTPRRRIGCLPAMLEPSAPGQDILVGAFQARPEDARVVLLGRAAGGLAETLAARPGPTRSALIAAASESASRLRNSRPVRPSSITSAGPPSSEATTARPAAIPSITT